MLRCLRRLAPARCLRLWGLFNAGCCRRVWPLLADERLRHAVTAFERYAIGSCAYQEWAARREVVEAARAGWETAVAIACRGQWSGEDEKDQCLELHRALHAARAVA